MTEVKTSGISDAIEKAGSQQLLAQILGVRQQSISQWLHRGWAPLRRAVEIEAQLGVPRKSLINPRIIDLAGLDQ